MGESFSRAWHERIHPDEYPDTHNPPTFDPMLGFPNGRKKREMKTTWEEMENGRLAFWERDYCAHHKVDLYRCRQKHWPHAGYYCSHLKHNWFQCEYEDLLGRMKEYEREHRLLLRAKRKRLREEEKQLRTAIMAEKEQRAHV